MKVFFSVAALMLVATGASLLTAASSDQDAMMAGMQKCEVCKNLAADPALMQNMTWETHKIDNGMLCVSTVPKEMKSQFEALNAKMKASVDKAKMETAEGKEPELCQMCKDMSALLKAGAKEQEIAIPNGAIHMTTSDDPAVVAKIHAEADKVMAMQKKMATK